MYLRIDNGEISFVSKGINIIEDTDILIEKEEYDEFFRLQSEGKKFKVKDKTTGIGLFDYIEEDLSENFQPILPTEPSFVERLKALELAMLEVL